INATNTPGDADSIFNISAPGSYYLTANIQAQVFSNKHGIEITTSGVSIDLNGFELRGGAGMGAFDAIRANGADLTNITIRNGSIRDWGAYGIQTIAPVRISDIVVSGCSEYGIFVGSDSSIANCIARNNDGDGIHGTTCTVTDCVASDNGGYGIYLSQGTILNCVTRGNTTSGIRTGGGTISGCYASQNLQHGIEGNSCVITDCVAASNTGDGIEVSSFSIVRGNTCTFNGLNSGDGAGIRVSFNDNRIEGNNCTQADRGIDVNGSGNVIFRNTCADNTVNWDIAANNIFGAIVDRRTPANAAVSGNSAPSSAGTTDPNANFSY
ncbi:MAG: right-handed parallel beta-helix repeat-containing protein, partial [Phycisphaerales bacterium]|nr:right-handed parallel beta-helix repeat-containing protein [Phycisphaerales bacterium]